MVLRLLAALCAALLSFSALAAAVVEQLSGEVRAGVGTTLPAVSLNQRVVSGMTVTTGGKSQAILRFDDGQVVVLNEASEFTISDYRFDKDKPQADNIVFQLLKGAMRSVAGLIGTRSRGAFALRVPQATIGIRGTDFMVAVVNPAYVQVLSGAVSATNVAGTAVLAAGTTASIATAATLAAVIPAAALPATVAASFGQMAGVAVGVGAGVGAGAVAPGAAPAAAAAPAVGAGTVAVAAGAAVAAAVAAAAAPSPTTAHVTTTTHH